MGFLQQCFVRTWSEHIENMLKNMGYKEGLITMVKSSTYTDLGFGSPQYNVVNKGIPRNGVDCGEDENFFLAVAAMRDDSDYLQWFIDEDNNWVICLGKSIKTDKVDNWENYEDIGFFLRKATLEDIKNKYKNI